MNPSSFTGDTNLPVETVTWPEAMNYCGKLTEREQTAGRLPAGYVYRLPTEAEWEYACRAGTTTRFSYGDDLNYTSLESFAWYAPNSGDTPHPVGQKQPNAWGLYDMYGNVWELCLDWYGTYPGGSVTDPKGAAGTPSSNCIIRGGSWIFVGGRCRSATRYHDWPDAVNTTYGFRVVLAPGQ